MRDTEKDMVNAFVNYTTSNYDELKARNFVSAIDNAINNFGFNRDEVADAIMANPSGKFIMNLVISCWLQCLRYQYTHNMYDGRNEYSVVFGGTVFNKIPLPIELTKFGFSNESDIEKCLNNFNKKSFCKQNNIHIGQYVSAYMTRNHRTLQQSFSSLIFYILHKYYNIIVIGDNQHWYDGPCI